MPQWVQFSETEWQKARTDTPKLSFDIHMLMNVLPPRINNVRNMVGSCRMTPMVDLCYVWRPLGRGAHHKVLTFTQGTYTGLRVSPPSRTGTRMTTDFHSAVGSGQDSRRATSALYTAGTGQQVTFYPGF